jgi:hypothetical protein
MKETDMFVVQMKASTPCFILPSTKWEFAGLAKTEREAKAHAKKIRARHLHYQGARISVRVINL